MIDIPVPSSIPTHGNTLGTGIPIVIGASPREGCGAFLARHIADQYSTRLILLREYSIEPCIACGLCSVKPNQCRFDGDDDGRFLLNTICNASAVIVIAPVYFYGPPSQLKALIDRAQSIWSAHHTESYISELNHNTIKFGCIFTAERMNGEHLFDASRLILNCFANILGFTPIQPLCLRGMNGLSDAKKSIEQVDVWCDSLISRRDIK